MAAADTFPGSAPAAGERRTLRAEQLLFQRYAARRDAADRELLVVRYMPLARRLAARYQRPDEPFDDLFQVACFGLLKAIDRFEAGRGVAFSSYAVPTIIGEIKRHFRDRTWALRVPRDLQEMSLRVDRVVEDLTRGLGHQPSVAEVARVLETDEEEVLEALEVSAAYRATSLQAPRPGENDAGDTLGDAVGAVDDGYERAEDRAMLTHLMRRLDARDREVLRLRFEEDLTQAEIGRRLGTSQMQVSRVLRHALARLRELGQAAAEAGQEPPARRRRTTSSSMPCARSRPAARPPSARMPRSA